MKKTSSGTKTHIAQSVLFKKNVKMTDVNVWIYSGDKAWARIAADAGMDTWLGRGKKMQGGC